MDLSDTVSTYNYEQTKVLHIHMCHELTRTAVVAPRTECCSGREGRREEDGLKGAGGEELDGMRVDYEHDVKIVAPEVSARWVPPQNSTL